MLNSVYVKGPMGARVIALDQAQAKLTQQMCQKYSSIKANSLNG